VSDCDPKQKLDYYLETSPLNVLRSREGCEPFKVTLKFTVSNPGEPVTCTELIFDLGRQGSAASDLTTQFPLGGTAVAGDGSPWSVTPRGGRFSVEPGAGNSGLIGTSALVVQMSDIPVNQASGTVHLVITEVLTTQTASDAKQLFKHEGPQCDIQILSAAPMRGERVHLKYEATFADQCTFGPGDQATSAPLSCADYVSEPLEAETAFTLTANSSIPSYAAQKSVSVKPVDPDPDTGVLPLQITTSAAASTLIPHPAKPEIFVVSGTMQKLDTIAASVTDIDELSGGSSAAFAPDRHTLYVASGDRVMAWNEDLRQRPTVVSFLAAERVAINGSVSRVYAASQTQLVAIDTQSTAICAGPTYLKRSLSVMTGASHFLFLIGGWFPGWNGTYVCLFDTEAWQQTAEIVLKPAGAYVHDACAVGGGNLLFVSTGAGLQLISVMGNASQILASPGRGLALSPDGTTVYFANTSAGTLDLFDTAGKQLASKAIGGQPWGVAVESDGSRVYVTDEQTSQIKVIGLKPRPSSLKAGCQSAVPSLGFSVD